MKRFFDFFVSFFALLLLFPIIFISWSLATYSTRSNGVFVQERVGFNGSIFKIYKLKTMLPKLTNSDSSITALNTSRITKIGFFLRKYKLDELPQLYNVLLGQMSLVGPRPDVPGYADSLVGIERNVLLIKPGITGLATIYFKNEENILLSVKDPLKFNDTVIYPLKTFINIEYYNCKNIWFDIDLIFITLTGTSIFGNNIIPFKKPSDCINKLESFYLNS